MQRLLLLPALVTACTVPEPIEPARFEQVGVVEGFYGPPWSHQDRLDMLRFMGRVGLTHYYYAPKNDPYHLSRWQEPYPDDAYRQLGELATVARAEGVTFVYAISPGGSIVYADTSDYGELLAKLDRVARLGVSDFALFVDDVPPQLQHAEDRTAYESLAQAHAALITRLHRDLAERGRTFAVTPTTYTNAWGDRAYLERLGALTPPEIPFFWTGIDVAAPEITAAQAAEWGELIGRRPLIWDNFPVNDFARWRLFLGPVRDRDPDLASAASGILSNPMNEAHASMISLATLAAYSSDPEAYDPEQAVADAMARLYSPEVASFLRPFAEIYGDDAFEHNVFEPLFIPANVLVLPPITEALAALQTGLEGLTAASEEDPDLAVLVSELEPFVTRTARRLDELRNDERWQSSGDSLVYRVESDRVTASRRDAGIAVDGDLREWSGTTWHPVGGAMHPEGPSMAALWREDSLYVAVDIPDDSPDGRGGHRVGEGDNVALVVQADTDPNRRHLDPGDQTVLLPGPPAAGAFAGRLPFRGFMAKYLADNRDLVWSEFMVSTFGDVAPSAEIRWGRAESGTGWTVEFAIPAAGRDRVRLSLSVMDVDDDGTRTTYTLASRNYPANPATFAEVVIEP
jgi:hyaluronoglucosaminidase